MTEKLADYCPGTLPATADCLLDIPAGGRILVFRPFAAVHRLEDKAQQARCLAAMQACGAPYSMTLPEIDAPGMCDTAIEGPGKALLSTEPDGGGTTTPETPAIARQATRNLLIHAGIRKGDVVAVVTEPIAWAAHRPLRPPPCRAPVRAER